MKRRARYSEVVWTLGSARWLALKESKVNSPPMAPLVCRRSFHPAGTSGKAQKQNTTVLLAPLQISLHRAHPAAQDSPGTNLQKVGKCPSQNVPRGPRAAKGRCRRACIWVNVLIGSWSSVACPDSNPLNVSLSGRGRQRWMCRAIETIHPCVGILPRASVSFTRVQKI